MFSSPTKHAGKRGRVAALAITVVFAFAAAAQAAPAPGPSATPTFDPNNPADLRLQKIFQSFDTKRGKVEGTIAIIEAQLVDIENQLVTLRAALAKSEADLKLRQAQLAAAIAKLNAQRALLKGSVATIYMRGPWSYLDAILNAEDLSSLVRLDVYSQTVLGDFIRILHKVEDEKANVERIYKKVRQQTIDLRAQTAGVEQQEAKVMAKQQIAFQQRQVLILGLVADFGGLDALKAHGFDIIIKSYAGSSTRITNDLTAVQQVQDKALTAQPNGKPEDVAKAAFGTLLWPVTDHRITSPWGWRIHPLWGYRSFHTGIDIASAYGAPVVSVADGVVVDVAYMGAYGLAVVIDHDHSLATVYAHLSATQVQKGDVVKAGDQIGNIGCSGWCTGPHIHFEIRLQSQPTNPVYWL